MFYDDLRYGYKPSRPRTGNRRDFGANAFMSAF
jgi:hypothetical protein